MGTVPETYDPRGRNIEYRRTSSGDDGESSTINDQCGIIILCHIGARLCFLFVSYELHKAIQQNRTHKNKKYEINLHHGFKNEITAVLFKCVLFYFTY